ncbi:MAG: RsmB/NOP family class I SAM-dependent RNA methyltransferase [Proteobacteria bacterium]|nr:RsmB/NOP family class I SAM-dependent RNA methyltransferase [Pseudomonadota bacterium]
MTRGHAALQADTPGLAARRVAADILEGVLYRARPLDELLDGRLAHPGLSALADRDRALARRVIATVLRRLGTLRRLLATLAEKGTPAAAPRVEIALLVGAAQILWLDVPDHAAVDLAVRLAQADRRANRYAGLVNAVLRRIAQDKAAHIPANESGTIDTPPWLFQRWTKTYGRKTAVAIAQANRQEPALDLSVKDQPEEWAARLRGRLLPTGSIRIIAHGPVPLLPGYIEGRWWIQDAAAALPARLLGDVRDRSVVDLCAAPGGKTAQLVCAGARVTAIDRSEERVARLRANLSRLGLNAATVVADATEWQGGPFDAVLLDAPCISTGTIRRHPDIAWLKRESDISALAALQARLLDNAVALARPGGLIVYSTCSLEPEEGEAIVAAVLARDARVRRCPVVAEEVYGLTDILTAAGDLRTLPFHLPDLDARMAGLDGFYAARLQRV